MIQGTAYKFGDNVNSDIIIPGRYLIHIDAPTLGGYAFEPLGKETQERIKKHSILIAGRNFGCGSAREQAATAIQGIGIKAVVAASFARTSAARSGRRPAARSVDLEVEARSAPRPGRSRRRNRRLTTSPWSS